MQENERVMESLKQLEPTTIKSLVNCVDGLKEKLDIDFIMSDLTDIVTESKTGIERVRKIVQDLKDFAHVDKTEFQLADINEGIEKTLQLVWNEIKYKTTVEKDYGDIPQIACMPGQLNQVYMNLLVNASQAIEKHGIIRIKTHADETNVYIEISDDGCGVVEENRSKIFDAFFTTKPVGEGTGLGLSISYTIIQKHGGDIRIQSEERKGTTFLITLPIRDVQDKFMN
jgi:signal transduction histidine kinase